MAETTPKMPYWHVYTDTDGISRQERFTLSNFRFQGVGPDVASGPRPTLGTGQLEDDPVDEDWPEPDDEPEEPEEEPDVPTFVSAGSTRTRSTPSSVRAICACTVTSPWPTSAAAVCTSASGSPPASESRTRAVEKSSKPSE